MNLSRVLLPLLLLQGPFSIGRGDVSDKQLQEWIDKSALTFTGTIMELGRANVRLEPTDVPILVKVQRIESATPRAMETFRSLPQKQVTVVVNSLPNGIRAMKRGIPMVFFTNPLVYEAHVGVTATAAVDSSAAPNLSNRISTAAERKADAPLKVAIANSDRIVTGTVSEIRTLS